MTFLHRALTWSYGWPTTIRLSARSRCPHPRTTRIQAPLPGCRGRCRWLESGSHQPYRERPLKPAFRTGAPHRRIHRLPHRRLHTQKAFATITPTSTTSPRPRTKDQGPQSKHPRPNIPPPPKEKSPGSNPGPLLILYNCGTPARSGGSKRAAELKPPSLPPPPSRSPSRPQ